MSQYWGNQHKSNTMFHQKMVPVYSKNEFIEIKRISFENITTLQQIHEHIKPLPEHPPPFHKTVHENLVGICNKAPS